MKSRSAIRRMKKVVRALNWSYWIGYTPLYFAHFRQTNCYGDYNKKIIKQDK